MACATQIFFLILIYDFSYISEFEGYTYVSCDTCIILLRSELEILSTGDLIVDRKVAGDTNDLKAILQREYTYEQVIKMADDIVAEMELVYESSKLPNKPDLEQINELCIQLVEMQGF